mmetsp:Transcript_46473/g.145426  ORF Transcript_46473/g.145426 Transcript_46473/m.145426 type:complete len:316 (-) Transcript_46473:407-1354(-)
MDAYLRLGGPLQGALKAPGGLVVRRVQGHEREDLLKVQHDALVGHGLELVVRVVLAAGDAAREHAPLQVPVVHLVIEQHVLGHPHHRTDLHVARVRQAPRPALEPHRAAPEQPDLVPGVHLKVKHHARDAEGLVTHLGDVRYDVLADTLDLRRQHRAAERRRATVVVRPLVGDAALVEPEAAVVQLPHVLAALEKADLRAPDGADHGVICALGLHEALQDAAAVLEARVQELVQRILIEVLNVGLVARRLRVLLLVRRRQRHVVRHHIRADDALRHGLLDARIHEVLLVLALDGPVHAREVPGHRMPELVHHRIR